MVSNSLSRRLLYKLLLYFAVLAVVFLLAVLLLNMRSQYLVERQLRQNLQNSFISSTVRLDERLAGMRQAMVSISQIEDYYSIFKPSSQYTAADSIDVNKFRKIINSANVAVDRTVGRACFILDDKKILSADGLQDFEFFFSTSDAYVKYPAEYIRTLLFGQFGVKILSPDARFISHDLPNAGKGFVLYLMPMKIGGNRIVLLIEYDLNFMVRSLKEGSFLPETSYIVVDSNNELIFSTLNDQKAVNAFLGGQDLSGDYIIDSAVIELLDYTVYSMLPKSIFRSYLPGITNYAAILSLFILFAIAGVAFVFSRNIYRPIISIGDLLFSRTSTSGTVRKKNELVQIREQIDSILNEKDSLSNNMQRALRQYAGISFTCALNDYSPLNEALMLQMLGIGEADCAVFCCLSISVVSRGTGSASAETGTKLGDYLRERLEMLFYKHCRIYVYETAPLQYTCLCASSGNETLRASVRYALANLESLGTSDSYQLYCGISECFSDLSGLKHAYNQSCTALIHAYANRAEGICCSAFGSFEAKNQRIFSQEDEICIAECLREGWNEEIALRTEQIVRLNVQSAVMHYEILELFDNLFDIGFRLIKELNLSSSFDEKHYDRNSVLLTGPDYDAKLFGLLDFYRQIISRLPISEKPSRQDKVVEQVKQHIIRHCNEDIHLEAIAEAFHMSSGYLSRLFKSVAGTNISDYINEIRIMNAIDLLKTTDMTVESIAQAVGFSNKTTFLRQFKKYTSASPKKYRN